jgi:SsrA-binding protein
MGEQTIALNRKARHDYLIEDSIEAGIALTGTEIKSVRAHKANITDGFVRIERRQAWLVGAHIAPWEGGNRWNHEAKRDRRLLLHKFQIITLGVKMKAKGMSIVPLRLYIDARGRAKVELGLGRGKKLYDRRRDIAERDSRRDMARELADATRGR